MDNCMPALISTVKLYKTDAMDVLAHLGKHKTAYRSGLWPFMSPWSPHALS